MSYLFALLLFWAPLCLVVGAKTYFFGALYKNSGASMHSGHRAKVIWETSVSEGAEIGTEVKQGYKVAPIPVWSFQIVLRFCVSGIAVNTDEEQQRLLLLPVEGPP